jgi:hypothetical protein
MRDTITLVMSCVAALVLILTVVWIVQGNDFFLYKVFAPQYEQTRREVFEQSKAYNQGMIQELLNMQQEYLRASTEHQQALKSIILHRSADFNLDQPQVPAFLRAFIQELQGGSREKTSRY